MTKELFNSTWVSRLNGFNQLIVGFSGGLDSTVLLHALSSYPLLRNKLLAVHINHGISARSIIWENHCQQACLALEVDFIARSVQFNRSANIEEGARTARYVVFSSLIGDNDCLLLGHHLNDQAETVLLQLFRGAGVDGLAAMNELSHLGEGALFRPLLSYSREQLEDYAAAYGLKWIEDESNEDIKYSRNYLRHQIIPLLAEKWPRAVDNIARAALHCQQAKTNLNDLAIIDSQELMTPSTFLSIEPLKVLSLERITNVLRVWLKNNQVSPPSTITLHRMIHEVLFAKTDATPIVSWNEIQIRRYQDQLYLDKKEVIDLPSCTIWSEFPLPLALTPNMLLTVKKSRQGLLIPDHASIAVKFRRGGEALFWHGQTKQLKKLYQEWGIAPWLRDKIPLIYINNELAAVVGYAISDRFFVSSNSLLTTEHLVSIEVNLNRTLEF